VVIMPYPENERAVRAYEAAGFVRDAVVPEHEVHEGVMRDGLRMVYRPR
jgi:RimJ/RimL family protein N-acetyltransferase